MSTRRRFKPHPHFHGVLLVDKPAGITSHDVVDAVRRIAGQREVGHTGTLDPAATGLLILCLGDATRISEYLMRMTKVYEGAMRLGAVSDTHDADGQVILRDPPPPFTLEQLREIAKGFLGEIEQTPPPHSAKKIAGKKLYEYARAGEAVEVQPRAVMIHRFDVLDLQPPSGDSDASARPEAAFEVECGSGTYVRRLVHDFGEDAGCGAYLSRLRRTRIGPIRIEDACTLPYLEEDPQRLAAAVLPAARALGMWPSAKANEQVFGLLKRGHAFPAAWAPLDPPDAKLEWMDTVLIVDASGRVLAVARYVPAPSSPPPKLLAEYRGAWLQPIKQFPTPLP